LELRPVLRTDFDRCAEIGFALQALGAFTTPCGWHDEPIPVDCVQSYLWDWCDPQLPRCLHAGPHRFEFLMSDSD